MRKLIAILTAIVGLASPAFAATFTVTGGTAIATSAVVGNDFDQALINAGYTMFDYGGTLDVAGSDSVLIQEKGAESGFNDSLNVGGTLLVTETCGPACIFNGGDQSATPDNMFLKPGVVVGTLTLVGPGDLVVGGVDALSFTTSGPTDTATNGAGDAGWGVFYNPNDLSSVVIGYDDGGAGPDGDHDDIMLMLTLMPEPATWALMIAGFIFLAFVQRRRAPAGRL